MDEREHAQIHMNEKIAKLKAAEDLLMSTKRTLQLLDEQIEVLSAGRVAVAADVDVSSEHRVAWLGVTDDNDHMDGILYSDSNIVIPVGWGDPVKGTIRNQEDAAFVCTNIFVAQHMDNISAEATTGIFAEGFESTFADENLHVRLTDLNTGRNLVSGFTTGPIDLDRGAVPLSFISSSRFGMGAAIKHKLFAEFTIPRAGAIRVELFNLAPVSGVDPAKRMFLSLFGFKAYGA